MYRKQDEEDLRNNIFHLKKQLTGVISENQLLKVRVRKLQNEVIKRDKQMDTLLDPRQSPDLRKILHERSASFVISVKEKNNELLEMLQEKDIVIKRLQTQLEVTKLYSQHQKKYFAGSDYDSKIKTLRIPCFKSETSEKFDDKTWKKKEKTLSWTSELPQQDENNDTKSDQYKGLSRDHLLSIIESLKNQRPTSQQISSRKSSPESDLDRIELCDSPHEEIQQLHIHFLDMLSEVGHLKNTIAYLQNNQERTEHVLKKKDGNFDRLAQEIKNLKNCKPKNKPRNRIKNDVITRIYSASSEKTCSRLAKQKHKENPDVKNKKFQKNTKKNDVMTQVEEITSPESNLSYIEKGSITIKQKIDEIKEFGYEDETFECEETNRTDDTLF